MDDDMVMKPAEGREVPVLVRAAVGPMADVMHLQPVAADAPVDRATVLVAVENAAALAGRHRLAGRPDGLAVDVVFDRADAHGVFEVP